jgi:hypothetical protein
VTDPRVNERRVQKIAEQGIEGSGGYQINEILRNLALDLLDERVEVERLTKELDQYRNGPICDLASYCAKMNVDCALEVKLEVTNAKERVAELALDIDDSQRSLNSPKFKEFGELTHRFQVALHDLRIAMGKT